MAKLAYYASRIAPDKPHQLETPEGFRIYTAVKVCRTGFQEYLGRELKGHPDYDPAWNLADDEVVKVFRPKDVVTAPETVASFEGKSVTDGHPPDDVALVMVENEDEYGRGHMQNLRVGSPIEEGEAEGETPLVADLFVKSQPLNDKIDGGVREVSCGYVFSMKRADDGTLVMTRICGNHVAVVAKGRAGPEVAIRDAKPAALAVETTTTKQKRKPMSQNNNSLFGRMLKAFAKDAEPEEVAEAAKLAGDAEEKSLEKKDEMVEELHPDLKKHIEDTKARLDAMCEHMGVGKKKEGEEEVVDPAAGDAEVLEMTTEEQGKTELPKQIADAATVENLTALRPKVVAAKDAAMTKAFNDRVKAVKAAAKDDSDVYAQLAATAAVDSATVESDPDPMSFFNGVSYAEGQRRYNEYVAGKAKKGGK